MKTTLLIMAAGIGSRFGTGIKQLEPVDDANHLIMDYSIHDAIEAGFNHVVFIIRKDALGYLYEHRDEADHHQLMLTLRSILFAVREGVF